MRAEIGGMRAELVVATPDADLLVVNAARASFGKESKMEVTVCDTQEEAEAFASTAYGYVDDAWIMSDRWMGGYPVIHLSDRDVRLINFLAREKHLLPFRHPHITLRCKAPIFVARQLGKHQTGMSWSEESRRYIDSEPEFFWPDKWRKRAENVKQGSTDEPSEYMHDEKYGGGNWNTINEYVQDEVVGSVVNMYKAMIANGVAPEMARMVLPQNMMITWVWTGSLLAWAYMIKERSHPTAQKETREFAEMVKSIMYDVAPASMQALMEYQ